jgi:hypothetical protein
MAKGGRACTSVRWRSQVSNEPNGLGASIIMPRGSGFSVIENLLRQRADRARVRMVRMIAEHIVFPAIDEPQSPGTRGGLVELASAVFSSCCLTIFVIR